VDRSLLKGQNLGAIFIYLWDYSWCYSICYDVESLLIIQGLNIFVCIDVYTLVMIWFYKSP